MRRIVAAQMVVFGRSKGRRSSYRQWEEGNIAPQVVFEVVSPSNSVSEMKIKQGLYDQFGVQEYIALVFFRNLINTTNFLKKFILR
jgi:hypothetical protein